MLRFINGSHYCKVWTTKWLSNDEKELEIAKMRKEQSLQFSLFHDHVEDPLPKNRKRIAYALQLDSCKINVPSR